MVILLFFITICLLFIFLLFGRSKMISGLESKSGNDLLIGLIEDGLKGDIEGLEMQARRLASKLKKSDPKLSESISKLVSSSGCLRQSSSSHNTPTPVEPDSRQKLLIETYPVILRSQPVWTPAIEKNIERFLRERVMSEELLNEGLLPSRSLLMSGPPGVGKTLTAQSIASKLDLPLLTLDLASVMSSYLGKTGNNIKAVLNYASAFPCVLLLDEFDAIAKKRDDDSDVGELKRLVTVLLQAIDDWPVTSVLVAATNHGDLLDPAIWRRFDSLLEFDYPTPEQVYDFSIQWGFDKPTSTWLSENIVKASLAIIDKKFQQAKKNNILDDKSLLLSLIEVFEFKGAPDDLDIKRELSLELHNLGWTNKQVGEFLGMTGQRAGVLIREMRETVENPQQSLVLAEG
ncbi:AAA family ATPase [Thalassotalea euphylliae]|uniref:AAA family ATPase n=1 Tax=Thalassotalea euphylliae TaxID=1655234 RepID=A0A3E0U3E4_9GAMM|nr:ATP-binding protein [Thalassotalea euphylliae]REL31289.1 AAA family ATPase [Thalassotalea euphylliae]